MPRTTTTPISMTKPSTATAGHPIVAPMVTRGLLHPPSPRQGSAADRPKPMAADGDGNASGHGRSGPVIGSLRGPSKPVGDPAHGAPPCRHAALSPAETR